MSEHRPFLALLATDAPGRSTAEHLLARTLDLLPVKVVITDANLRIAHVNFAAAAMLASGDPIWSRHGLLNGTTAITTMALIAAIRAALQGDARGIKEVPLPCRDGRAVIAHVQSLEFAKVCTDSRLSKMVALFITEPEIQTSPPLGALAQLFELTPAEGRVLQHIASGKNRKEAAAALGLADSTVKTHLDHLYLKTGVSDQIGLRRLVNSLSWPSCRVVR